MKAKLIINNVELALGHRDLEQIAFSLDDLPGHRDIFHELALSPHSELRSTIAGHRELHPRTIKHLIADSALEVMRIVISSDQARPHMTREDIDRHLATDDCEILSTLADDLEDFTDIHDVCEKDWLCEKLFQQPDPAVRFKLAENSDTPPFFLRKLSRDSDINVAAKARETLAYLDEDEDDEDDD